MARQGRSLRKQWTDKKPFTRRARWYDNATAPNNELGYGNIRIELTDNLGQVNRFYGEDIDQAKKDWQSFKDSEFVTTQNLRR